MFDPEVVLSQRTVNVPNEVILELIAGTQAGNGYVLLTEVCVNRRFARERRRQILDVRRGCVHNAAVCFAHADVIHLEFFIRRGVRKDELSETFYADATFAEGASLEWTGAVEERALYVVDGAIAVGAERADAGTMLVFEREAPLRIEASTRSRVMLLGGAPLDAPRFVWWNFVSSRKERIREAAEHWKAQRFPPVPGDTEYIPLPERSPGVVDYP